MSCMAGSHVLCQGLSFLGDGNWETKQRNTNVIAVKRDQPQNCARSSAKQNRDERLCRSTPVQTYHFDIEVQG